MMIEFRTWNEKSLSSKVENKEYASALGVEKRQQNY
jgi:hypothetical protein